MALTAPRAIPMMPLVLSPPLPLSVEVEDEDEEGCTASTVDEGRAPFPVPVTQSQGLVVVDAAPAMIPSESVVVASASTACPFGPQP